MAFKNHCVLVLWMKVASALEALRSAVVMSWPAHTAEASNQPSCLPSAKPFVLRCYRRPIVSEPALWWSAAIVAGNLGEELWLSQVIIRCACCLLAGVCLRGAQEQGALLLPCWHHLALMQSPSQPPGRASWQVCVCVVHRSKVPSSFHAGTILLSCNLLLSRPGVPPGRCVSAWCTGARCSPPSMLAQSCSHAISFSTGPGLPQ